MRSFPIIPIWLMAIICILLLIYVIKYNNKNINHIIIIILIFIINLRIMIPSNNAQILANNLDVLFVIDNTVSMNAEDYEGNQTRMSGVKKDCQFIIKRLNGARFSIINFNNIAKIVTPFTKDYNITSEAIDIMSPIDELYAKGSSLNVPIEAIIDSLKTSEEKEDRIRILFFISDGEITDESKLESYSEIANHVNNGAILGYGTTTGGYMKNTSEYKTDEYIMYYSNGYNKALSKLDENNLKQIANDTKLEYIHMDKQSNLNAKLKEIENIIKNGIESSDKSTYDDTYFFFIIPLIIVIMLEFNKFRRKNI